MYAQFSGLFSSLLLLTTLISGLSAAACSPLSGVPTGDLLLTAFLLLINSWSLVLCRSLPPSKGADSTLTSMFNRLHSVPFGSYRSQSNPFFPQRVRLLILIAFVKLPLLFEILSLLLLLLQSMPGKRRRTSNDAQWCLDNSNTLTVKNFAIEFGLTDRHYTATRY
ncbi:hypothetical protein G6F18_013687 [Rhizopus arrhizus]|uniref:Uncharacterized protein n=1 Tax=Rhizopus oryzae TaxID=64495 RepID=A0A9P7BKH0_RHIOR|nr:hypothetical protein G6F24_014845 [Rhizopus arrhizus]KAG0776485.1 hypothetical protein G6F21_013633 [Rhizopus arrhizus]KAG0809592.1 hypothetical protein G6F18_013687 [Rhizopus arrhizus]KAG0881638.1 hypothetical protein G6F34_013667 [Rhizopus arrhizus]KAG0925301.1 hypothetical protein G6F32_013605 [Rhizopus arrhizus]